VNETSKATRPAAAPAFRPVQRALSARPGPAARWMLLLALSGLTACGGGSLWSSGSNSLNARSAPATVPLRAPDPLADFAARATPGQEEFVGNPPVSARLLRTYNSGGGRPCRELLLGSQAAGAQLVYCEDAPGQWVAVRPLLRNGAQAGPLAFARP